jgi:hypothetical protein
VGRDEPADELSGGMELLGEREPRPAADELELERRRDRIALGREL